MRPDAAHEVSSASLLAELQQLYADDVAALRRSLTACLQGSPLCPVVNQLTGAGGKHIRPLLAWTSCTAVGGRTEVVADVVLAAELLHSATLLHDDVLDDGAQRRGVPAARILYGNQMSVLAGDFLLSRALDAVLRTRAQQLLVSFSGCLDRVIEGEVLQNKSLFCFDVPEATYRQIIELKTATLFAWTARSAVFLAGADEGTVRAFEDFGRHTGVAFQILDDWLDWFGDKAVVGKAVHADLKEGKPSLPLLYACQASPAVKTWLHERVRADTRPPEKEELVWLTEELRACGAGKRVRKTLESEMSRALAALPSAVSNEGRRQLSKVVYLTVTRSH